MAARQSPYARLLHDLENSSKVQQDVVSGKRIGLYRLKGQLGAGNFSRVKLGVHLLTNERVAVKIMDRTKLDDIARKLLSREITCMEKLEHPNIICLFEVQESFSRLCLFMECASEGDVHSRVVEDGPFPEEQARGVFAQVSAGIAHMHSIDIAHRDLKPENVFYVSEKCIKIGDFGFSTPAADQALDTFCGSPPYAAPELFLDVSYQGPPVDAWAMGVMLYFMITGNVPFQGNTVPQLKEKILQGSYTMPKRASPACQEVIGGLLTYKATERTTATDVQTHAWLEGVEEVNDLIKTALTSHPDAEVLEHMKTLGVPTNDETVLLGEPRSDIAGTYRILHHRKLVNGSLKEQEEEATNVPLTEKKEVHFNASSAAGGKSKICIIL